MKLIYSAFLTAVMALGTTAYAQSQDQSSPQQDKQEKQQPADAAKASYTGCLTKGTSDGNYMITDQASGEKVNFSGPSQIDRFVNQTVKLTGTVSGQGAEKVFNPESIAQVAPSCGKAQ